MSKLVRDEAGSLSGRTLVEAADHPSLFVKQRTGAFERWIAFWEPRQLQLKVGDRRPDQRHRLVGIGSGGHQLRMQGSGCNSDRFKSVHRVFKDSKERPVAQA
jgi:hypothetical protein